MKRLLAILLLFTTATFTRADQTGDTEFVRLFKQVTKLNTLITAWNTNCGDAPTLSEDHKQICDQVKVGVATYLQKWVTQANVYKPLGDPKDCHTVVHSAVIDITIKIFNWNLQYGARSGMSPEDRKKAYLILSAYMDEKLAIQQDWTDCDDAELPSLL